MDLSMKNQSAYIKLHSLPEKLKAQALEFIDFLYQKNRDSKPNNPPKAGFLKGKIVIGKDFDEPLEDFKEYT